MPHPFPNATNLNTTLDLFNYANTVTGEGLFLFGSSMVFVAWVVLFVSVMVFTREVGKALMSSGFVVFLFAVLLNIVGVVNELAVVMPFLGVLVGILVDKVNQPASEV